MSGKPQGEECCIDEVQSLKRSSVLSPPSSPLTAVAQRAGLVMKKILVGGLDSMGRGMGQYEAGLQAPFSKSLGGFKGKNQH